MLRINCKDHRTNESVLNEIGANREFVTTIKKRKLQYFGHMIQAQNRCTHMFEGRLDGTRKAYKTMGRHQRLDKQESAQTYI